MWRNSRDYSRPSLEATIFHISAALAHLPYLLLRELPRPQKQAFWTTLSDLQGGVLTDGREPRSGSDFVNGLKDRAFDIIHHSREIKVLTVHWGRPPKVIAFSVFRGLRVRVERLRYRPCRRMLSPV